MNRTDIAILLISLALATSLFVGTFHSSAVGAYALIGTESAPAMRVDLRKNQLVHVHGPLGETTLEVKDGSIRFTASPCPNKICIHSGWHNTSGDFAACLPNHVTLQIVGDSRSYDSLSY